MQTVKGITAILAVAVLCAPADTRAQQDAPMMVKSQAGVELNADVDWAMCAPDGVQIGGYDLVSYRDANGPVKGSADFAAQHDGFTYWFSSESKRAAFLEQPDRFLPEYSGFCAITLALGRVTCPEYTNFKIEDDRLLLFEVTGFTNGRSLWNSDSNGFKRQADDNYSRLNQLR